MDLLLESLQVLYILELNLEIEGDIGVAKDRCHLAIERFSADT